MLVCGKTDIAQKIREGGRREKKLQMKNKDEKRMCLYCEFASDINDPDMVLCKEKGPVENSFCCKKFYFDIFKLSPTPKKLPEFDPSESFSDIIAKN